MKDKDYFKIWAPDQSEWTQWVKPVPFMLISTVEKNKFLFNPILPPVDSVESLGKHTALIIDRPSHEAILEGIAYAQKGFRPIPLYNGTFPPSHAMALVDQTTIQQALVWGAHQLNKIVLDEKAPPAFLLDSHRLLRYKMNATIFDNSWDLYDQDIPSPEYFKDRGITSIVVRCERIYRDLHRILYKFQTKKITIYRQDEDGNLHTIHLRKPPKRDRYH